MSRVPRRIRIDATDPDSIESGLYLLQQYKIFETSAIVGTFPAKICNMAVEVARNTYAEDGGSGVKVTWERSETGNGMQFKIVAKGREVCFIEFGTGVFAESGHPFADSSKLGFVVAPGSWSMLDPEGKKEYLQTDRASDYINPATGAPYPPGPVPLPEWEYNREQRPGLLKAYNAIINKFEQVAKEVFLDRDWGE